MTAYRILHVDDDPLMRDVVELALNLDPAFVLMTCEGADEALAAVPGWAPDLILCDVLMPDMDGLALLARLRENPETAKIPVILMTARAGPEELERFRALGAAAVITKPFYPMNLADTVRRHLQTIRLASAGYDFSNRLRADAIALATFRTRLREDANPNGVPDELQSLVHKLAGAAGVFNYQSVSSTALALEDAIIECRAGKAAPEAVEAKFDALLECIERT